MKTEHDLTIPPDQWVDDFGRDGFSAPHDAISPASAASLLAQLHEVERRHGRNIWARGETGFKKPHLFIRRVAELAREPAILDAVERLLGPDILVMGSSLFAKPARDAGFFNWHQDANYLALSEPAAVTAWVALTPSTPANGCLRVVRGSHRTALPHRVTTGTPSLLSRGQEVDAKVDEARAVDLILAPGQMSLHHVMVVHGSKPNASGVPRIGVGIHYIAGRVTHGPGHQLSAALVRGEDRSKHYVLEPTPTADFEPACVSFYERLQAAAGRNP